MMASVGLPTGLIRYASEHNIAKNRPWLFTAKMKAYTLVMCLLLGTLAWLLASRSDVNVTLLRSSGQLYQERSGGRMSNLYNYKALNKTFRDKEIVLKPDNFDGTIELVGETQLLVPKDGTIAGTMFIYLNNKDIHDRKTQLKIGVYENGKRLATIATSFLGPFNGN
jgi:polyferredoxin